jgi:flagellar protein FliO/FliZ
MLDGLFSDMPTITKFFAAFVVVLALIAAFFWLWRRFAGARLGGGATRGRQPRLAVIDAAVVDGRRRLVLVRRDNVEHLVMIGGPTDVVIEQNIVRAVPVAPAREAPVGRGQQEPTPPPMPPPRGPELSAPRADTAPPWPLQPELAPRAVEPEPVFRPQRAPRAPEPEPTQRAPRLAEPEPARQRFVEPESMPAPRIEPRPEPRPTPPERAPFRPAPQATRQAEPVRAPEPRPAAPPDANLADMAQRLEAALRRPGQPPETRGDGAVRAAPEVAPPVREAPVREPRPEPPRPPAPDQARAAPPPPEPRPDARPASPKSVLDSLEQEMASLLGRPSGGKE